MDENEQIVEKNTQGSADFEAHKNTHGRDDAPSDELDIERNSLGRGTLGAADDGDDFEAHKLKVDRPTAQRPSLQ